MAIQHLKNSADPMKKYDPCPCTSKQVYHKCCMPYHDGKPPENALLLMRSRYSAYALGLADYIIETTHPEHSEYANNKDEWKMSIQSFSEHTRFNALSIVSFIDGAMEATVTFTAHLKQADQDASFTEVSRFVKDKGRWLYKSGKIKSQ